MPQAILTTSFSSVASLSSLRTLFLSGGVAGLTIVVEAASVQTATTGVIVATLQGISQRFVAEDAGLWYRIRSVPNADGTTVPIGSAIVWVAADSASNSSGADPSFATQATWFIDGQNVTGKASDSNDGLTAASPLLTDRERARRVGAYQVSITTTVTILSDLQPQDYITEPTVGLNGVFFVTGSQGVTVLHTGTLTGATSQSGNSDATITDSAVTWTSGGPGGSSLLFNRLRVTSGENVNAICALTASLSAHVADVSDPEILSTDPSQFFLTSVSLSTGDPYRIERLPKINTIVSPYGVEVGEGTSGADVRFMYEGIAINTPATAITGVRYPFTRQFVGCSMGDCPPTGNCLACYWGPRFSIQIPPGTELFALGCAFILSGDLGAELIVAPGAALTMDQGTVTRAGSVRVGGWLGIGVYAGGTFEGGSAGVGGSPSDGVVVIPGGVVQAQFAFWGSGNSGFGIRVQSGGQVAYGTKPTLTGTSGDTAVGGTTKAYAAIPFLNTSNNAMVVALA